MAIIKETEPMTICIQALSATRKAPQPSLLVVSNNIPGQIDCGVSNIYPWEGQ